VGKGRVGWYSIRVTNPAQAAEVAKRVDEEFENSPSETKTEPEGRSFRMGRADRQYCPDCRGDPGRGVLYDPAGDGNTCPRQCGNAPASWACSRPLLHSNQVVALVLAESCLLSLLGGIIGLGLPGWRSRAATRLTASCRCSSSRSATWSPESPELRAGHRHGIFPALQPCACASRTP